MCVASPLDPIVCLLCAWLGSKRALALMPPRPKESEENQKTRRHGRDSRPEQEDLDNRTFVCVRIRPSFFFLLLKVGVGVTRVERGAGAGGQVA